MSDEIKLIVFAVWLIVFAVWLLIPVFIYIASIVREAEGSAE